MTLATTAPHAHGVPQLLTSGLRSYEPTDFEEVSVRQETWRFTPIDQFASLLSDHPARVDVQVKAVANPSVSVATSDFDGEPTAGYVPTDRLAASIWRNAATVTRLTIGRGASIEEPLEVSLSASNGTASHVLVVDVQQEAQVSLVIAHEGEHALGSTIVLNLGAAARVDITLVQRNDSAIAVYAHHTLSRDASLTSNVVSLGSTCARVVPTVAYSGPGAEADLRGIAIAGPGQHIEHRSLVNHEVPNCRSNVAYKNLLNGEAERPSRTVWIGDVIIHAAALGTDTYELNRNLVIGDHARADSVPNLEIETGEIAGAGHASATGRLDDEQVFYLQSRGIDETEAKRLIVRGFFEDLLAGIKHESVTAAVRERLEAVLA